MRPGEKILVVENHSATRDVMRQLLEGEGYRVACAANGREALNCLHEGEPPCVILLDLRLPVMDGWEFGREIRHDPQLAPIPVVIISGEYDLPATAASLGAAEYCWKPIKFDWLLGAIRRLCTSVRPSPQNSK
jgi:two-component system chemotaxis response regulator CheY